MKKAFLILVCLLILISASGCVKIYPAGDPNATSETKQTDTPTDKPVLTPTKTERPMPSIAPAPTPHISMVPTATPAMTPSGMSPYPSNTLPFYSSYAFMVSYDPARGWADFDYFDMLTGQDAIDWMVAHEGYTVAEATDIVDDWGDGEYWLKNTNPTLRTIDLKEVDVELMYHADGTQSLDSTSIPSTVSDVFALYNLDADYYLYDSFFFYIHVDASGNVTKVQQIYWC